jgi:aldose 1-epimerase
MKVNHIYTGKFIEGKEIICIELTNRRGTYVKIYNYGAIISSFVVVNAHGEKQDIVLGFDDIDGYLNEDYLADYPYFGAIIGRYANRIGDAQFILDGKSYQLAKNAGPDTLHGGTTGFDKKVFDVLPTIDSSVTLRYISPAGEENFPGNVAVEVTFKLSDDDHMPDDELTLDIKATSDAATPVNLTHHGYFNLSPDGGSIAQHIHRIPASHTLEQDSNYVVTGNLLPVAGTPLDFQVAKPIGQDWNPEEGYDQTFVLDKQYGELTLASETFEPKSGLTLEISTTDPVAHFYTAKYTNVRNGKDGKNYQPFEAFCIETQHHPNAINIPEFPNTVLRPGEIYSQTTIYRIINRRKW